MKTELLDVLKVFRANKESLLMEIQAFVQDKTIPIDDRWEVFRFAGWLDILPYMPEFFDPDGMKEDFSIGDDTNIQRYEMYCPKHLINRNKYLIEEGSDPIIIDLNAFKESYMQEFIWESKYDW